MTGIRKSELEKHTPIPDNSTGNDSNSEDLPPVVIRYLPVIVLAILAIVGFFVVNAQRSITGRPTMDMLLGLGALNLLVYLWLR